MGRLGRRVKRLEDRFGSTPEERQAITEAQVQEAMKRLTDEELVAIEGAFERFEAEGRLEDESIPYSELTDFELRTFIKLYRDLLGSGDGGASKALREREKGTPT